MPFDTGLLTVDARLQVHISGALADGSAQVLSPGSTTGARRYATILLPEQAQLPGHKYLDWHRTNIFFADQKPSSERRGHVSPG